MSQLMKWTNNLGSENFNLHEQALINSLRTVVTYMHQGNKYFIVRKNHNFATLHSINLNQFHFIYYNILYILLHWARRNNQPEAENPP